MSLLSADFTGDRRGQVLGPWSRRPPKSKGMGAREQPETDPPPGPSRKTSRRSRCGRR